MYLSQDQNRFLLFFVSIALCFGCNQKTDIQCEDNTGIYSAMVDTVEQVMQQGASDLDELAVIDSTETFAFNKYSTTPDSTELLEELPDLNSTTFIQFLKKNKERKSLPEELDIKDRIPCDRDNPESRCVYFSDIGFNSSCNQALLSYTYICGKGSRCGLKNFVLLAKENGEWVIQDHFISYMI